MLRRAIISLGLSLAVLISAFLLFAVLATSFKHPSRAPEWLIVPAHFVFAWPLHLFSRIFPNTSCLDGHEICGYSGEVYLATAVTLPLLYSVFFYVLLSWRERRASKNHA